ncbi:hypothetical protein BIW11_05184 [Tropilaelaps mercedesae]|uniref:TIR domain-containing protein n=1 Tax=Tropilaelaps mercedesae TaxID=418985 RepID=A0A1V9Y3H4_9ACAR|nr:hypothetical protein BIW11_05184 [Tropilaelaps mercedesae]
MAASWGLTNLTSRTTNNFVTSAVTPSGMNLGRTSTAVNYSDNATFAIAEATSPSITQDTTVASEFIEVSNLVNTSSTTLHKSSATTAAPTRMVLKTPTVRAVTTASSDRSLSSTVEITGATDSTIKFMQNNGMSIDSNTQSSGESFDTAADVIRRSDNQAIDTSNTSTSATPDIAVNGSILNAPDASMSTTLEPTVTSESAKVITLRTTRELRIPTTSLAQQSTTPKSRLRRDANPFRIEDFLQKMGFEEFEPALEIEYTKRPYGSHVTIDCNTASPNIRGLFSHLGIKDVTSIKYKNCDLPAGRLKFVHIFEGNTKNITKVELNRPRISEGPLKALIFDEIATWIVELHIIWSAPRAVPAVTSLSDDFFKNFRSLTALSLKANALDRMPPSVSYLKELSTLDLSMNLITAITSEMFAGLKSLTTLYLGKNPIALFKPKPFADLRNLRTLELNSVKAKEIPENLLEGLSSLIYLKMDSWVNLKSLPAKLFTTTVRLETLHFSEAMSIEKLPEGIFDSMFRLNATYVRSCNLTSVPARLFINAPVIKMIDFSGNALSGLPQGFLSENARLESLFLSGNRIQTLRNEFEALYALKELSLNGNHLTEISSKAFENLISLQTLDLSRNRITKIEKNALLHLKKLEKIDIRENNLECFGGSTPTFSAGSPIREIYLSKNRLTTFPRIQFQALPKLSILDLDDNEIQFFAVPLFASMDTKVFLRRNRLEFVSIELAKSYPKQESIYSSAVGTHRFHLEGNPFKCDCNIYNFLRYLQKEMKPEVAEFEHVELYQCSDRDEALLSVKLDLLSCRVSDCPSGCECFLQAHDASMHVRCRDLGLASIPKLPSNVTHLDFEGNVLKHYPGELALYKQLREVVLDGNNINNVDELFVNAPPSLQLVSLTGNRLEALRLVSTNISYRMALANNPWICDCSALEFKRFVRSNIVNIPDYRSITCKKSYLINGTEVSLLNDIPDDIFCPPDVSVYRVSVITLSVLFLLAIFIIALYYKNRQLIIAYVYIHFYNVFVCFFSEGDLDEDKKFDAFISYSSKDRDVVMALLQEFEKPQGDESSENLFKLCIHERDWLPGYNISWNIVNSVQNSRRTILVLSQDFIKSLWFEVEFRTAYVQMMEDRINRLIVIIKGEIPPKDSLDSDLRFLLGTKTYLEWGEKWFWEKLKYALPHKGNLSGSLKNKIKPSELHKVLPMSVMTSKNQVPNIETVVRVEDAIETAKNSKAAKRSSPDDSTYGSTSYFVPQKTFGKMGHINKGYEPVSTENIHSICTEPDPNGIISHTVSFERRPAPHSARKKEVSQPQTGAMSSLTNNSASLTEHSVELAPVKSARLRHTAPKAEAL